MPVFYVFNSVFRLPPREIVIHHRHNTKTPQLTSNLSSSIAYPSTHVPRKLRSARQRLLHNLTVSRSLNIYYVTNITNVNLPRSSVTACLHMQNDSPCTSIELLDKKGIIIKNITVLLTTDVMPVGTGYGLVCPYLFVHQRILSIIGENRGLV